MGHGRRPAARIGAGALVLLVHALAIRVFLAGDGQPPPAEVLQFVSLWPQEPPRFVPPPPVRATAGSSHAAPPRDPAPAEPADGPAEEVPPEGPVSPAIDWDGEAALSARRLTAGKEEPSFGSPLPEAPKPCRVQKWKWTPEEKRAGLAPLPYVLIGKRCVIGLGFFGCTPGALPEVDTDQLDAWKRGEEAGSSVPDPDYCD
jgi:hypothetical protein